ncbi:MAG: sigma-54-dependent transcriptional regulator, partial [Planctomycetota bacterium]
MPQNEVDNPAARVMIVEDEEAHADAMQEGLERRGHHCQVVHDGAAAIARLQAEDFDIVVTDLVLGGAEDGLDVLQTARKHAPDAKVILVTAHSSVETCRQALQQGAFDYVEKPLDLDELRTLVDRAAELTAQKRTIHELREQLDDKYGFENIIGNSPAMLKVLEKVRRVAPTNLPVLILGESGTGKELVA